MKLLFTIVKLILFSLQMKYQPSYQLSMKNNQQLLIFHGLGHISHRSSSKKSECFCFYSLIWYTHGRIHEGTVLITQCKTGQHSVTQYLHFRHTVVFFIQNLISLWNIRAAPRWSTCGGIGLISVSVLPCLSDCLSHQRAGVLLVTDQDGTWRGGAAWYPSTPLYNTQTEGQRWRWRRDNKWSGTPLNF